MQPRYLKVYDYYGNQMSMVFESLEKLAEHETKKDETIYELLFVGPEKINVEIAEARKNHV